MNVTLKDIKAENSTYAISLVKLTGLKVKDIKGYISCDFGDPVFKLCDIVFENELELDCQGEHDLPYVFPSQDIPPNMDNDTLQFLYDEENGPQD